VPLREWLLSSNGRDAQMRVTAIETLIVDCDWRKPIFVRLRTEEGLTGLGECTATYGTGVLAVETMARELGETFVVGRDPCNVEGIYQRIMRECFWARGAGNITLMSAISGIEQACWDIFGKSVNLPVWALLGGKCRDKVRVYANNWYVEARGDGRAEAFGEAAARTVEAGYTAMKFDPWMGLEKGRVGPGLYAERDIQEGVIARVRLVREAVGPDVEILLEAHACMNVPTAILMGKRLAEFDCFFYEEPVDPSNPAMMREVAQQSPIRLASGERIATTFGFREYIENQSLAVIQPDTGICGGILEAKKIASLAHTYQIYVAPHNCCGPVNTAASVHLDAAIPNFLIQEVFPCEPEYHYHLVEPALELSIKEGYVDVPNRPGLGVELNEEVAQAHRWDGNWTRYAGA